MSPAAPTHQAIISVHRASGCSDFATARTSTLRFERSGISSSRALAATHATGVPVVDLLVETRLAASKSAARRLIQQGGASLNGTRLTDLDALVTNADLHDGTLLLRAGKKHYHRVVVE